jgi:hypothetical protein
MLKSKLAIKRLKRKRELKRRIKCHGTNNSCLREHPIRIVKVETPKIEKKVGLGWWAKLKQWLNL